MSILIKGLEMPKEGFVEIIVWSDGLVQQTGQTYRLDGEDYYTPYIGEVPQEFSATELPPHGDLIDRDAFMKKDVPFNGHWDENDGRFHCYPPTYMQAVDDIRMAPTVIEAEG